MYQEFKHGLKSLECYLPQEHALHMAGGASPLLHGNTPSFPFLPTDHGEGGGGGLRKRIHIFINIVNVLSRIRGMYNNSLINLSQMPTTFFFNIFNINFFNNKSVGFISFSAFSRGFTPFLPELFTCYE